MARGPVPGMEHRGQAIVLSRQDHEGLVPGQIAVLFEDAKRAGEIRKKRCLRDHPVMDCTHVLEDVLVVDSVHRFKGLERPVVLLVLGNDGALHGCIHIANNEIDIRIELGMMMRPFKTKIEDTIQARLKNLLGKEGSAA